MTISVAIVKYNAGNIESVGNALRRLGVEALVTDRAEDLRAAEKVIFPGVGEASSAMSYLHEKGLDDIIRSLKQPVLGICLGMQLLGLSSEENDTECLGIIPYRTQRFIAGELKIPHIGWNRIFRLRGPLFEGVDEGTHVYFVHGFRVDAGPETTAVCDYGGEFAAASESGNFFATQFHPEKSGEAGARILENFIKIGSNI